MQSCHQHPLPHEEHQAPPLAVQSRAMLQDGLASGHDTQYMSESAFRTVVHAAPTGATTDISRASTMARRRDSEDMDNLQGMSSSANSADPLASRLNTDKGCLERKLSEVITGKTEMLKQVMHYQEASSEATTVLAASKDALLRLQTENLALCQQLKRQSDMDTRLREQMAELSEHASQLCSVEVELRARIERLSTQNADLTHWQKRVVTLEGELLLAQMRTQGQWKASDLLKTLADEGDDVVDHGRNFPARISRIENKTAEELSTLLANKQQELKNRDYELEKLIQDRERERQEFKRTLAQFQEEIHRNHEQARAHEANLLCQIKDRDDQLEQLSQEHEVEKYERQAALDELNQFRDGHFLPVWDQRASRRKQCTTSDALRDPHTYTDQPGNAAHHQENDMHSILMFRANSDDDPCFMQLLKSAPTTTGEGNTKTREIEGLKVAHQAEKRALQMKLAEALQQGYNAADEAVRAQAKVEELKKQVADLSSAITAADDKLKGKDAEIAILNATAEQGVKQVNDRYQELLSSFSNLGIKIVH